MPNQIQETHKRAKENIVLIAQILFHTEKIPDRVYHLILENIRTIQDEPHWMLIEMADTELTLEENGKVYRLKVTKELIGDLPKTKK